MRKSPILRRTALSGLSALILSLPVLSCSDYQIIPHNENPPMDSEKTCIDYDNDGYGIEGLDFCQFPEEDCNDQDEQINPGAAEVCDYKDNNCNGEADEGVLIRSFPDEDNDEQGDLYSGGIEDCSIPEGHVENSDDCDDTEPTTYLGALELCDGIDNNCNEQIDEDYNIGNTCQLEVDECQIEGNVVCSEDQTSTECAEAGILNDQSQAEASCLEQLISNPSSINGIYWIDPNQGTTDDAYKVLCDMTTAGGGWTLIIQSLSDDDTFKYSSSYWTDSNLLNEDILHPGCTTAKYQSFLDLESTEFMLNLTNNRDNRSMYTHDTPITPQNLFSMEDNDIQPDSSNLDPSEWTVYPPECTSYEGEGYVATLAHEVDRVWVKWDVKHYSTVSVGHAGAGIGFYLEPVWPCNGEWGSKDSVLMWIR